MPTFAKLFFFVSVIGFVMYVLLAFFSIHTAYLKISQLKDVQKRVWYFLDLDARIDKDLKYVLFWHPIEGLVDLYSTNEGQKPFISENCPLINCYATLNASLLGGDYSNFDAIVFPKLPNKKFFHRLHRKPKLRKLHQKYIFYSKVSSEEEVVCNEKIDGYFNWTWSYRLDSDIFSPFMEVRDLNDNFVAPGAVIKWINSSKTDEDVRLIKSKKKAVAWLVHSCLTRNHRMLFAKQLQFALRSYALDLDIFGECDYKKCPNNTDAGCLKLFKRDYYFNLVLEGSVAEDYVTEEVLIAVNSSTVPVILGVADYTKFLPTGSYINVLHQSPHELAAIINYLINHPEDYYRYFNWRTNYKIREHRSKGDFCQLCTLLNSEKFKKISVYDRFREWWYRGHLSERCYLTDNNMVV